MTGKEKWIPKEAVRFESLYIILRGEKLGDVGHLGESKWFLDKMNGALRRTDGKYDSVWQFGGDVNL